jgi:hypothetical protein
VVLISFSILREEGGADVFEVRRWTMESESTDSDGMDKGSDSEDDETGFEF